MAKYELESEIARVHEEIDELEKALPSADLEDTNRIHENLNYCESYLGELYAKLHYSEEADLND